MATRPVSFRQFILSGINRRYLISWVAVSTMLWVIFRFLYPNPNIIFDSYHYINAAVTGDVINAWPIGYSWLIRVIGTFTHSVYALLTLQYLLLQGALLFFFYTFCYFIQPGKRYTQILFLLFISNPIFLFTCNLVLSDALFTTFSLLWLSQLLWIIYLPNNYMVLTHALILLIAFTIRYNALYYPFVATFVYLLCKTRPTFKTAGIALSFASVAAFTLFTTHKMEQRYGNRQFSAFGGWKLANDALYMYEHVYLKHTDALPVELRALDNRVRYYFSKPHQAVDMLYNDATWGSYYMYMYPSPLITYMHTCYGRDAYPADFRNFARMGSLYQQYGTYLIRQHPMAFIRHFVLPNVQRYFAPPQEVYVDSVNPFHLRKDILTYRAIEWFGLRSLQAPARLKKFRSQLFSLYPSFTIAAHLFFLLTGILLFFYRSYATLSWQHRSTLLSIAILWLSDFGFNILAAGVVMRYQLFILVMETTFSLYFIQVILQQNQTSKTQQPFSTSSF